MTPELAKSLKEKNITSCDTTTLGWMIGHLYDHGLTRVEIESVIGFILDGIDKMKADPAMHQASELMLESANRAANS
jgi:hypothetical protein